MDKDEHFKLFDTLGGCLYDQLFDSSKYREELSLVKSSEIDQDPIDSASKENQSNKFRTSGRTILFSRNIKRK